MKQLSSGVNGPPAAGGSAARGQPAAHRMNDAAPDRPAVAVEDMDDLDRAGDVIGEGPLQP